MILVVTLLLLAVVFVFVGYPLARPFPHEAVRPDPAPGPALSQRERLLAEREQTLATLQELDFEHGIGNLSDEDYAALQGPHRRKAVVILRELDAIGDEAAGARPRLAVDDQVLAARLEDEIARVRTRLAAPVSRGVTPTAPNAGPAGVVDEAAPLCLKCGAPHAVAARFCAACGHKLRPDSADGVEHVGSVQETRE